MRGILAQKPLAMSYAEASRLVAACSRAGILLQVNQNMRYDHSVRALKSLIDDQVLGEPVLATIEMRAIPHWMPWAQGGRSLSTFVMSIHHLDTFRYWLGDPVRVLSSTRPDPRTRFPHTDGINLYVLEFEAERVPPGWDDVWAGPAREGAASEIAVKWRFEGTEGLALGAIGWPGWPDRIPSTIDYSTDPGPGCLASPALGGSLVSRRLRRHDGKLAPRSGNGQTTRHPRKRQPENDRPLRSRPRRRTRAPGRAPR